MQDRRERCGLRSGRIFDTFAENANSHAAGELMGLVPRQARPGCVYSVRSVPSHSHHDQVEPLLSVRGQFVSV